VRNRIAAALLFLSWPVCVVHRYWEKSPYHPVHWVVFDKTVYEDFRWPIFHAELWLSAVFVLLAWLISTSKTYTLRTLLWANLLISGIDIIHYILYFRRNIWFLSAEGMIMVIATVIIAIHVSNYRNEKTR
jgi:hypothetical protein